ncbi:TonB-dependent receptor SusC [compost metagenome]
MGDQYILNISARRDGSSRFGINKRFSNFWSAGGAWIFTSQDYVKERIKWLSFGKISSSFGITGNDQIGDYQFIRTYSNYNLQRPYQGITSMQSFELPNPDLVWERVKKLSFGIDLGFFQDRILLNVNYQQNQSDNQLVFSQLPSITGANSMIRNENGVIVRNKTWEFSLNTTNLKRTGLSWNTIFTLSIARNKLLAYPNLEKSSAAQRYVIGQPIDIQKVSRFAGVNAATGDYEYLDKNGNPRNTVAGLTEDDILYRSLASPFYGGIQNTINWKNLSLDFFIQFTKQWGTNFEYYNGISALAPGIFDVALGGGNQPVSVLNRWQHYGDNSKFAKYSTVPFNKNTEISGSDAVFKDASFARLKNLSLTYNLPNKWATKSGLQSLKVTLSGQNLYTITNYDGPDPETNGLIGLPPLRVYSIGLQLIL